MHARAHVVAILVFILAAAIPFAWAEDRPQSGVRSEGPPSITYGASRTSGTWIETPGGTRVAVGRGVEWKGVKVYLSLLWDLVAVDTKTKKTLYAVNVGAFWNGLGFKQVTQRGGTRVWAVELRPGPRTRAGKDRRQYHDLRSGKRLDVPGLVKGPSGKAFTPRAVWSGKHSRVPKPFHAVVSTAANWTKLTAHMFGTKVPKPFGKVDFETEVVLVVSAGNGWNCNGIGLSAAFEDARRLLVRTQRQSFQTIDGGEKVRPYGVFVLPKRAAKAYVVERNRQNLIGGPALWTESFRLARLLPPAKALAGLPAASDEPHRGWSR